MALFADASFAGDIIGSKSTSGGHLFLVGPNTWVPICWVCKKQTDVSHSSSEAEVISLDASLRVDGIPSLSLWDQVVEVFSPSKKGETSKPREGNHPILDLENVDYVPPSLPPHPR